MSEQTADILIFFHTTRFNTSLPQSAPNTMAATIMMPKIRKSLFFIHFLRSLPLIFLSIT